MKTFAAVLIAASLIAGGIFKTYKLGQEKGYSQGWSDAQCGKGQDCEAGQD